MRYRLAASLRVYASYAKSLFLISYYHRSRSLSPYDNIDIVDEFRKWLQLATIVAPNVSIQIIFFYKWCFDKNIFLLREDGR